MLDDPKDESRGYVDDFANYVDDLQSFLSIVQSSRKDSNKPLFMIAHSMGGAVASLLLERKNAAIKAVALITPMFEPWASGDQRGLLEKNADRYCDSWAANLPLAIPFLSTRYVDGAADTGRVNRQDVSNRTVVIDCSWSSSEVHRESLHGGPTVHSRHRTSVTAISGRPAC